MTLTPQEMDELQNILDGNSTHNGKSGTEGFYEYLNEKDDPYARLGLGVTNNNTWQGEIANGYAEKAAENMACFEDKNSNSHLMRSSVSISI